MQEERREENGELYRLVLMRSIHHRLERRSLSSIAPFHLYLAFGTLIVCVWGISRMKAETLEHSITGSINSPSV